MAANHPSVAPGPNSYLLSAVFCSSLAFYALGRRRMFPLAFGLRGSDRTMVRRSSHYANPCCNFDPL